MCKGINAVKSGDDKARDLFIIETLKELKTDSKAHREAISNLSLDVAFAQKDIASVKKKFDDMESGKSLMPLCVNNKKEVEDKINALDKKYDERTSVSIKKVALFVIAMLVSGTSFGLGKEIVGFLKILI